MTPRPARVGKRVFSIVPRFARSSLLAKLARENHGFRRAPDMVPN